MRRYEYVRFAVLVITFFMVALFGLTKVQAARSRRLPKMVCKAKQSTFEKRRLTNSLGTLNSIGNNIDESLENWKTLGSLIPSTMIHHFGCEMHAIKVLWL